MEWSPPRPPLADYGKKDRNPVDDCPFYRGAFPTSWAHIKADRVSHVGIPAAFRVREGERDASVSPRPSQRLHC